MTFFNCLFSIFFSFLTNKRYNNNCLTKNRKKASRVLRKCRLLPLKIESSYFYFCCQTISLCECAIYQEWSEVKMYGWHYCQTNWMLSGVIPPLFLQILIHFTSTSSKISLQELKGWASIETEQATAAGRTVEHKYMCSVCVITLTARGRRQYFCTAV